MDTTKTTNLNSLSSGSATPATQKSTCSSDDTPTQSDPLAELKWKIAGSTIVYRGDDKYIWRGLSGRETLNACKEHNAAIEAAYQLGMDDRALAHLIKLQNES